MAPWSSGPLTFTIPGTGPSLVELKVPPRGRIQNIRLYQAGTPVAATVQLFQSRAAAVSQLQNEDFVPFPTGDPRTQSVFGTKSLTAGVLEETAMRYDYQNRDSGITNAARRLWLVLQPVSETDVTYTLSLLIGNGGP